MVSWFYFSVNIIFLYLFICFYSFFFFSPNLGPSPSRYALMLNIEVNTNERSLMTFSVSVWRRKRSILFLCCCHSNPSFLFPRHLPPWLLIWERLTDGSESTHTHTHTLKFCWHHTGREPVGSMCSNSWYSVICRQCVAKNMRSILIYTYTGKRVWMPPSSVLVKSALISNKWNWNRMGGYASGFQFN